MQSRNGVLEIELPFGDPGVDACGAQLLEEALTPAAIPARLTGPDHEVPAGLERGSHGIQFSLRRQGPSLGTRVYLGIHKTF